MFHQLIAIIHIEISMVSYYRRGEKVQIMLGKVAGEQNALVSVKGSKE